MQIFYFNQQIWPALVIISATELARHRKRVLTFCVNYLLNVIFVPQGAEEVDSAPGAPQERSSPLDSHAYMAEVKELQRRYSMGQTLPEFQKWQDMAYRC